PNSRLQPHPPVFTAPSRVVTLLHYYVRVTPSLVTCSRHGGWSDDWCLSPASPPNQFFRSGSGWVSPDSGLFTDSYSDCATVVVVVVLLPPRFMYRWHTAAVVSNIPLWFETCFMDESLLRCDTLALLGCCFGAGYL
ncbi:hypothetical protein A2U01_0022497, partial [Trifolium medium]|nr:hypothetical protein [Trifolium medium]